MLRADDRIGAARMVFTERWGGVSEPPYAELNLGGHVGDDPLAVAENRRLIATGIGLPVDRVLYMNQVHGNAVAVADGPWREPAPEVDALVTREPDLALAVLSVSCGMAPESGQVIFAVARIAGWIAHALEEYAEPPLRLRPSGVYRGPRPPRPLP
jgi:copper oxidase (laccase) domain-containing protein